MGLFHSGLEREHREDNGQNNYVSLVYTAYSNTHRNCSGTDSQGHVHTVHITVLTSVIRCLSKQLPKMKWKKNLYLTVIWSIWHHTDFWQQRQNRMFFFLFFLFFFLFFFFCFFNLLNVQLSVAVICRKLSYPFFSLKTYWFQLRRKNQREGNSINAIQSVPQHTTFLYCF